MEPGDAASATGDFLLDAGTGGSDDEIGAIYDGLPDAPPEETRPPVSPRRRGSPSASVGRVASKTARPTMGFNNARYQASGFLVRVALTAVVVGIVEALLIYGVHAYPNLAFQVMANVTYMAAGLAVGVGFYRKVAKNIHFNPIQTQQQELIKTAKHKATRSSSGQRHL